MKTIRRKAKQIFSLVGDNLGLSGSKDSTDLAVLLHKERPDINMEYFFYDTGKELEETYEYLERIEARLGITIQYLSSERHSLEKRCRPIPHTHSSRKTPTATVVY